MRRWWSGAVMLMTLAGTLPAQTMVIGVDPRVELMATVFRLAEAREFVNNDLVGYADAVDAHFGPFRNHDVVRIARELRAANGVGYDAVMGMAAHLEFGDRVSLRGDLDGPTRTLDVRWTNDGARRFVTALNQFATESRFRDFRASQRAFHDSASARLAALVERRVSPA
jgi:hypothetical protein